MSTNITDHSIDEIKRGYFHDSEEDAFFCLICGEKFERGMIYTVDTKLCDAEKAAGLHIRSTHGSAFEAYIGLDKKLTGLTPTQTAAMRRFYEGRRDADIAREDGSSQSAVRFQRYSLREKAKQAKLFLALSELMEQSIAAERGTEDTLPVHETAVMVDERYMVSEEEAAKIESTYFSSLSPLRLKSFPPKEKRKLVVLRRIVRELDRSKVYTEREISAELREIFEDFAMLRRCLVMYGFVERNRDGSEYRVL